MPCCALLWWKEIQALSCVVLTASGALACEIMIFVSENATLKTGIRPTLRTSSCAPPFSCDTRLQDLCARLSMQLAEVA